MTRQSLAIASLVIPLFCLLLYILNIAFPPAIGTHLYDAPLATLTLVLYLFLPIILVPALFIAIWVMTKVQGKYKTISITAIALDIILLVLRFLGGSGSF